MHSHMGPQLHELNLAPWSPVFLRLFQEGWHNQDLRSMSSHMDPILQNLVRSVTLDAGMIPGDLERSLELGIDVFILSERCAVDPRVIQEVWRHSLRTGYLAAVIALHLRSDQRTVWQSFVGGVLHDVGMLVFLIQCPQVFLTVVDMAQCRGCELAVMERQTLGSTHAESGAAFLGRWGVDEDLLATVAFHDDPTKVPSADFGVFTAVYAANLLEGGGVAQDGDGIIGTEGERYLTSLGLWDALPLWQGWMRTIQQATIPVNSEHFRPIKWQ